MLLTSEQSQSINLCQSTYDGYAGRNSLLGATLAAQKLA